MWVHVVYGNGRIVGATVIVRRTQMFTVLEFSNLSAVIVVKYTRVGRCSLCKNRPTYPFNRLPLNGAESRLVKFNKIRRIKVNENPRGIRLLLLLSPSSSSLVLCSFTRKL